jgi:hypothetical protein
MIEICIAFIVMVALITYAIWECAPPKYKSKLLSPFVHKKESTTIINQPQKIKGKENQRW